MAYEDSIPVGRGSRSTPAKKTAPKKAPARKAPARSSGGGTYVIKSGDTLSAIARRNGTTVAKLAAANGIKDPNKIMAGAKLNLGGGTTSSRSTRQNPVGTVPPEGIFKTGVAAGTGQLSRQGRGVYIPPKGTMYRKDNTAQQTQVRKGRDLSYTVDKGNAAQQTQIRKGRKLPNARSK